MTRFGARAIRWKIFITERFSPLVHLPMVAAFFAANALLGMRLADTTPPLDDLLASLVVTTLVFFRLRIFDDIKDASRDRHDHPDRPLARGQISLCEAKRTAAIIAVIEFALARCAGPIAATTWCFLFAYSLLMYREFFVGSWLRPKMELYAVSHTLVAGWLGLFVVVTATSRWPWDLPRAVWILIVVNWAIFNVFEFARKSWGRDEERSGIASYSSRLSPPGAVALTLSQALPAAAASAALLQSCSLPEIALVMSSLLGAGGLAAAIAYVLKPFQSCARIYRATMTFFILGIYGTLALFAAQRGMSS